MILLDPIRALEGEPELASRSLKKGKVVRIVGLVDKQFSIRAVEPGARGDILFLRIFHWAEIVSRRGLQQQNRVRARKLLSGHDTRSKGIDSPHDGHALRIPVHLLHPVQEKERDQADDKDQEAVFRVAQETSRA